jgi:hypothetical protein
VALDLFVGKGANAFGQCPKLAVTGAGGNYEIVGKNRLLADIQQQDVFAFFVFNRFYNLMC